MAQQSEGYSSTKTVKVKKGETVSDISRRLRIRERELRGVNPGVQTTSTGQVLNVPFQTPFTGTNAPVNGGASGRGPGRGIMMKPPVWGNGQPVQGPNVGNMIFNAMGGQNQQVGTTQYPMVNALGQATSNFFGAIGNGINNLMGANQAPAGSTDAFGNPIKPTPVNGFQTPFTGTGNTAVVKTNTPILTTVGGNEIVNRPPPVSGYQGLTPSQAQFLSPSSGQQGLTPSQAQITSGPSTANSYAPANTGANVTAGMPQPNPRVPPAVRPTGMYTGDPNDPSTAQWKAYWNYYSSLNKSQQQSVFGVSSAPPVMTLTQIRAMKDAQRRQKNAAAEEQGQAPVGNKPIMYQQAGTQSVNFNT